MINVLLTGAGFTANFGSPLAKHIYNILFNTPQVQNETKIREMFLLPENIEKANYENIYEQILGSDLNQDSKDAFNKLLLNIFLNDVDFYAKSPQWTDSPGFKTQNILLEKFIIKFCNSKNKSIFFTLNQDLFVERQCIRLFSEYQSDNLHIKEKLNRMNMDSSHPRNLKRLGVSDIITTKNINTPIEDDLIQHIQEENKNDAEKLYNNWLNNNSTYSFYLKLHGSLDYYYKNMPLFITGENKTGRIESCPLTKYYANVFETLLSKNDCKLIIIGYGFHDEHINKIISQFLKKPPENNEIYLIDNIDMQNFLKKLDGKINIDDLKKRMKGYFPNGLNSRTLASFIEPNLLFL